MSTTLEIYEHLKPKLGERETRELLEWIESEKLHLATKEDIQRLEIDIHALKEDMRRFATKDDMQRFATKEDIQIFKTELLKWILGSVWTAILLLLLGLYFKK